MSDAPQASRIPQDVTAAELVAALKAKPPAELAPVQRDLLELTRNGIQDTLSGAGGVADTAPENPRFVSYKAHYDRWSAAAQKRCSWAEVKARLLGNDNEDLNRAEDMTEKGILFGVDKQGNPLIADGGLGPILTDMNYADTRNAVRFTQKDGKQVPTGYEMFDREEEIRAFEAFTGRPVVQSPDDDEWRGIWLESGDTPGWARSADVRPGRDRANLHEDAPSNRAPVLGARRLLRVLKKS